MIKIVTDSSTLFSVKEGQAKNINIVPLSVTINDKTYKEIEDINTEEFISIINDGYIPMSSQPPIGEVINIYEKYQDDEIINISMADGLSGTYTTACMAKNMLEYGDRISVINSKTLCGPHRYLVEVAVKLAEANKSREEIVREIEELKETSKSFLIPNDFDFLVRGGRLNPVVGKIGGLIKLVPVMKQDDDGRTLVKFVTKRTFSKAILSICESLKELGVNENYKIYIAHACKEELANIAKGIILDNIICNDIEILKLSPAFTTQGGPGCIAIQMIKKHSILD